MTLDQQVDEFLKAHVRYEIINDGVVIPAETLRAVVAKALRPEGREQGWVSVEDRLPTERDPSFPDASVLVQMFCKAHNNWIGHYDFRARQWWCQQGMADDALLDGIYEVTHWKALDEPSPQEGSTNGS